MALAEIAHGGPPELERFAVQRDGRNVRLGVCGKQGSRIGGCHAGRRRLAELSSVHDVPLSCNTVLVSKPMHHNAVGVGGKAGLRRSPMRGRLG
jgi:hypothetical protein